MEYKTIESKNYQEIQNQYHINSLLAKIIESRHYDEKTMNSLMKDVYKRQNEYEAS